MSETPIWHRVGRQALRLGGRAAQELLSDQQRAELLMAAMRGVQGSRRALDGGSQRLLKALGLATQDDLAAIERRLGRLRKRLEALAETLEDA